MIEEFAPAFDAAPRAALEGGKPLVYVCPPAGWMITPWYKALSDDGQSDAMLLALAADTGSVLDVAQALHRATPERTIYPVTGLSRAARRLKAQTIQTLVATPEDAIYLMQRSALKAANIKHIALLWPEHMSDSARECLDSIVADAQTAQRFVATESPGAIDDLLERFAHRAPTVDAVPTPPGDVEKIRYAVVDDSRRVEAARAALDIIDPETTIIWNPNHTDAWRGLAKQPDVWLHDDAPEQEFSLAIAGDIPTPDILHALAAMASQVLVLARPHQVAWLTTTASHLKPLPLPGGSDLVRSEAQATRATLRRALETGPSASELLAIEPLLSQYDPSLIAAAALSLRTHAPKPVEQAPEKEGSPPPSTRLFLNVGTTDEVRAADIVGAIVRNSKIDAASVGKIDLRERFTLVDVPSEQADHVIRTVQGQKIRNRRATVRVDRPPPRK